MGFFLRETPYKKLSTIAFIYNIHNMLVKFVLHIYFSVNREKLFENETENCFQ